MLTLYIACLIFGGVLLLISAFGGGDSHADFDHSLDAHVDIGHPPDLSTEMIGDLEAQAELLPDIHTDTGGGIIPVEHDTSMAPVDHAAAVEAVKFLSFRNAVFFTAFFGMTGTALTVIAVHALITLLSSVGMGLFAANIGYRLMRYLKATESGTAMQHASLRGRIAVVTIDIAPPAFGKIRIESGGQRHQFVAVAAAEAARSIFRTGETVIVSRIEQGIAYVIESDDLI